MVKQWLTLFNDTPVQRFRNLNAIFRCQWSPRMASGTLYAGFRETMEEIGLSKFSTTEIAAAVIMMQAPQAQSFYFVKNDLFLRTEMVNLRSKLTRSWTCFVSIA
jgi:hypothetical protein